LTWRKWEKTLRPRLVYLALEVAEETMALLVRHKRVPGMTTQALATRTTNFLPGCAPDHNVDVNVI